MKCVEEYYDVKCTSTDKKKCGKLMYTWYKNKELNDLCYMRLVKEASGCKIEDALSLESLIKK